MKKNICIKNMVFPTDKIVPFDPGTICQREGFIKIIQEFSYSVETSLINSWRTFLHMLEKDDVPVSDNLKKIFTSGKLKSYILELLNKAGKLGKEVSRVVLPYGYIVREVVSAGMATGSIVTTQTSALMSEGWSSRVSLVLSKVSLDYIDQVQRSIGISPTVVSCEFKPCYDLFDHQGLNQEKLKEYGYGEAVGCPASLPISKETQKILEEYGLKAPRTMLEDFASMVHGEFQRIREWFNNLSEDERKQLHSEDVKILSGAVWEHAPRLEGGGCPMGRSKESL
ncbi:MAG: hypothetical protein N3A54_05515 [Patescibacteria group bacterium]|nr:hypothetical protein [Patescibacteria group bacterium]